MLGRKGLKFISLKKVEGEIYSQPGFVLVEIIVVVFIFVMISSVIFTVLAISQNCWSIANTRVDCQQELRKAMDHMVEELRQSGSYTINTVPPDGVWYNTITFQKPADVIDSSIIWGDEEIQYLTGGLNGKQLMRKSGDEVKILANGISSLQIRRQPTSPDVVEVALQVNKATSRGTQVGVNSNFKFKLRN